MLCTQPLQSARVLGAIYLKGTVWLFNENDCVRMIGSWMRIALLQITGAIIEKTSLSFAKRVLKITPPVPRRVGWEKTRTAAFHIKFRSDRGMNEVSTYLYILSAKSSCVHL